MLSADEVLKALEAAGLDTEAKLATFLGSAVKPLQRASIQAEIDAENKAFQALTEAHNETLKALQAKLNAV